MLDTIEDEATYYENKVRNGFPIGEVRAALLNKGYSEEKAVEIEKQIKLITATKSNESESSFRYFIGGAFIVLGILMCISSTNKIGYFLIISGLVKIIFDVLQKDKPKKLY
jgi:hypothetical protein